MEIEVITVNFKPLNKDIIKTMDEKISLEAIGAYGDAYADKVSKSFFSSKNKINGSEILSLCNVLRSTCSWCGNYCSHWREETKKLKSPYFDYEDAGG